VEYLWNIVVELLNLKPGEVISLFAKFESGKYSNCANKESHWQKERFRLISVICKGNSCSSHFVINWALIGNNNSELFSLICGLLKTR
jgi:hypothetical protein